LIDMSPSSHTYICGAASDIYGPRSIKWHDDCSRFYLIMTKMKLFCCFARTPLDRRVWALCLADQAFELCWGSCSKHLWRNADNRPIVHEYIEALHVLDISLTMYWVREWILSWRLSYISSRNSIYYFGSTILKDVL
jgi:hypothetical protein